MHRSRQQEEEEEEEEDLTSDGTKEISLYDDINSWKWSIEDKEIYAERAAEFTTWLQGQPNNANQHCVCIECDNRRPSKILKASQIMSVKIGLYKELWAFWSDNSTDQSNNH
ncbi:hypothetical protein PAMA_011298 [Pampus argenteus]